MSEQVVGFGGFQSDEDDSLKSKFGGVFGLNQNALITKFDFNPNAGKDGAAANALDIVVKVADKEFKFRKFEPTKVFDKDSNEITDTTSSEYIKKMNEEVKQIKGIITHYLKVFKTEEELKALYATASIQNFADLVKFASGVMAPDILAQKPVDVFLQYQWQIGADQKMTFLELPKNLKDGSFITAHQEPVGNWTPVIENGGLKYVDNANNVHRFHRDKNYMESAKAIQQKEGESSTSGSAPIPQNNTSSSGW